MDRIVMDRIVMDRDVLPLVMQPYDVQKVLGRSRSYVYQMFGLKDFPSIQIPGMRTKYVYRDQFFEWLDSKQQRVRLK